MEYVKVFLSIIDKVKNKGKDEDGNDLLYIGEMNVKSLLAQVLVTNMNDCHIFVDDGTAQIMIPYGTYTDFAFDVGQYLQIAIELKDRGDGSFYPEISNVLDLSLYPNRESLWSYEVVTLFNKYYKQLIFKNGFTFKKNKKVEKVEKEKEKEKEVFNIDDDDDYNGNNNDNQEGNVLMVEDLSLNQGDIDYDLVAQEEESMYMSSMQEEEDYSLYEDIKVVEDEKDNENEDGDGNGSKEVEHFFENDTDDDEDNIDQLLSFSNKRQRTKVNNNILEDNEDEQTENNNNNNDTNNTTIDDDQNSIDDFTWDE